MAREIEFCLRPTATTPEGTRRLTIDGIEQDLTQERFTGRAGAACELTITPPEDTTAAVPEHLRRLELQWSLWPTPQTFLGHGVEWVARAAGAEGPLGFPDEAEAETVQAEPSAIETAIETTADSRVADFTLPTPQLLADAILKPKPE